MALLSWQNRPYQASSWARWRWASGPCDALEGAQCPRDPAQRGRVAVQPALDPGQLEHEPRASASGRRPPGPRRAVGRCGSLVVAGVRSRASPSPSWTSGHLLARRRAGSRRPAASARSKKPAASALAWTARARCRCRQGERPRLVVALGMQVVQRQQVGLLLGLRRRPRTDGVADAGVQLAAQPVGQPVVGAVAEQGVAEDEVPVAVDGAGTPQPGPDRVVVVGDIVEDGAEQRRGRTTRPSTDTRRRSWRSSGGRRSMRAAITASTESGSESMSSASRAAATSSRRNRGLPPERSASTAIARARSGVRHWAARSTSSVAVLPCERAQPEPGRRLLGGDGTRSRRHGGSSRPTTGARPTTRSHVPQQFGRGLVHPVGVLDHEQAVGSPTARRQELGRGRPRRGVGPELRVELGRLRGVGHVEVEHDGDEGRPRERGRGASGSNASCNATPGLGGRPRSEPQRAPAPGARNACRRAGRFVVLARRPDAAPCPRPCARNSSTSRDLPTPGSPTTSTTSARTARGAPSHRLAQPGPARRGARRRAPRLRRRRTRVAEAAPTLDGLDRLRLALHHEGLHRRRLEAPRGTGLSTSGVARSCPARALAISRAARFTVSPMTVKVRR